MVLVSKGSCKVVTRLAVLLCERSHCAQSAGLCANLSRAAMIQGTAQNCPNAKIVMSGYSQGGQLVHNAAAMLPAATMAKVSSVVIFGDPSEWFITP